MRRGLAVVLALATILVPASHSLAAETMRPQLERTEGHFEAGMEGTGRMLFPEAVEAPDHERITFDVSPCHRSLSLGLVYEPANASAKVGQGGNEAEVILPYRFRAGLIAPDGEVLHRIVVDEPDLSIPFGVVEEPGEYTLELELLEGADVDWQTRVRGFNVYGEPSCELWLNEVELNPGGADAGREWVEVYNEGEQSFDLSDWRVNASSVDRVFSIPDGTTVEAGGYERVYLHPGTHLGNENETVELSGPVGGPVDDLVGADDRVDDERTWQREADGLGDWIFADGTPGEPNIE